MSGMHPYFKYHGDLDLAQFVLGLDAFVEGHIGLDAEEYCGEKPASEPGVVSLHLNGDVVDALLVERGWQHQTVSTPRGEYRTWLSPDGDGHHYERDEAIRLALTAEVL